MADRTSTSASPADLQKTVPKNEGNPALRMMGLPRLRTRLPSRNWMIFFAVTGSFAAAVTYDRQQKRRIQQKWCDAVSHLAEEPLSPQRMPRRITVFLEAPPGDYLLSARDYFKDFVKPILVAAAIEWELVEGRREGDIRHKLADKIRDRRRNLDRSSSGASGDGSVEDIIMQMREKSGIKPSDDRSGDLVIGRHTWKEYIRGLHEGWLGPLTAPPVRDSMNEATQVTQINGLVGDSITHRDTSLASHETEAFQDSNSDAGESAEQETTGAPPSVTEDGLLETMHNSGKAEEHKDQNSSSNDKVDTFTPYIRPLEYKMSDLPSTVPGVFDPVVVIGFPHLLGFLNTPVKMWRYVNKRKVAEETGKAVAAFVLSQDDQLRPFHEDSALALDSSDAVKGDPVDSEEGEWQQLAKAEEHDWHKSAKKANAEGEENKERPWQERMVVDWRLGHRMRTVDVDGSGFLDKQVASLADNSHGTADHIGQIVANSAGGVLSGTSGGDPTMSSTPQRRSMDWKGSADPKVAIGWASWMRSLVTLDRSEDQARPWQQGMQAEEEE